MKPETNLPTGIYIFFLTSTDSLGISLLFFFAAQPGTGKKWRMNSLTAERNEKASLVSISE